MHVRLSGCGNCSTENVALKIDYSSNCFEFPQFLVLCGSLDNSDSSDSFDSFTSNASLCTRVNIGDFSATYW